VASQQGRRRRLRVVCVTAEDLSKNSGYAFRVDAMRKAIEAAGHEAEVVGFRSKDAAIPCISIRSTSPLRRLFPLVQGIVRKSDCVVITSVGAPYNGLYAFLLRLIGKSVLYDCHDPVTDVVPMLWNLGILGKPIVSYIGWSERLIGKIATATFAGGPLFAQMLREAGWQSPILLFYNLGRAGEAGPSEAGDFRETLGWTGSTVLVYAGGFQNTRGLQQQIEAVTLARERGHDVRMLLVGFGDRAAVEASAGRLIAEGALHVETDVPPERLRRMLEACDVAVSSEPFRCGLQSKMLDYVRSGVRIVAIDDDRDIVRTFGELVIRYDGTTSGLAEVVARPPQRLSESERRAGSEIVESMQRTSSESVARVLAALAGERDPCASTP
jgi:glycosyltransferase involved in cell wall biosynthesis